MSMKGLYPIIRRIRRPLLPVDPPVQMKPVVAGPANESQPTDTGKSADVVDEKKVDASDSNK